MSDVFISYNRQDQTYARRLAEDMRRHGLDVWIDDRIAEGDHWFEAIEQGLMASKAVVVIMTPNAERSEWVRKEILLAKRENKPIFPLLLSGREFAILIDIQFAAVTRGQLPPADFYERVARATVILHTGGVGVPMPARGGRGLLTGGLVVALLLIATFALSAAGILPRFWAGAPPTATETAPVPTFPPLDGTYFPPIDISQFQPTMFPADQMIPLSPPTLDGGMFPPVVEKGGTPIPDAADSGTAQTFLTFVSAGDAESADAYVCPRYQGSLAYSFVRLMRERGVTSLEGISCIESGPNVVTCSYTLVNSDGTRTMESPEIKMEAGLVCAD